MMIWRHGRKMLYITPTPYGLGGRLLRMFNRVVAIAILLSGPVSATELQSPLPDPLSLGTVIRIAQENRNEIVAARARAAAAHQRPDIVSALEDPMIQWSVDHYPYEAMDGMARTRYDRSFMVEQRFPLSGVRGHRRRSAQADAVRLDAEADRTILDVAFEAVNSFQMLHERRRMRQVAEEQQVLARQLVAAASARYSAGGGSQADVLRAETELARIEARLNALAAEVRGAEAMLNASLGMPTHAPVPALLAPTHDVLPPSSEAVRTAASQHRPELRAGQADIQRAEAEVDVMRSMYRPMAMVRLGSATTMAEGDGAMFMVGVSVPLWRGALRAGVSEAQSMQHMARVDLQAMQLMVEGEAIAAREEVEATRAHSLALRDDVVPRARMAIDSALAAYRAGQGDMVNVIEATRTLWSTETELVMAEAALGLARARLERATGTTWEITP